MDLFCRCLEQPIMDYILALQFPIDIHKCGFRPPILSGAFLNLDLAKF